MKTEINWHNSVFTRILKDEADQLNVLFQHFPVRHVLQVSGTPRLLDAARVLSKAFMQTSYHQYHEQTFVGDFDELPLAPNSVDTIILHHSLEVAAHPSVVLKEIHRALPAGGRLIIFNFNPCSVWGLLKFGRFRQLHLHQRRFFTAGKCLRWLNMIGFSLVKRKSIGFFWPGKKEDHTRIDRVLQCLGKVFFRRWGAVNVLVLEKKAYAGRYVAVSNKQKIRKRQYQPTVATRSHYE